MGLILALLAGLVADAIFGEPRWLHPLVIFGRLAARLETAWNDDTVAAGGKAVGVLVGVPVVVVVWFVASLPAPLGWAAVAGLLYLALGRQSLAAHARAVATALAAEDREAARRAVARLVSRDTATMDDTAIRRATIESVLENASDAIVAPIVWTTLGGVLLGPAGAAAALLAHRLMNTLDAMWGYRTPRFDRFGRIAARADDVLNWPAARVTAAAFVVMGDRRAALDCWRRQAGHWTSPNAGPVMAAGAGALGITLGGGASYHGRWQEKPTLGCGSAPVAGDIERALTLTDQAVAGIAAVALLAAFT